MTDSMASRCVDCKSAVARRQKAWKQAEGGLTRATIITSHPRTLGNLAFVGTVTMNDSTTPRTAPNICTTPAYFANVAIARVARLEDDLHGHPKRAPCMALFFYPQQPHSEPGKLSGKVFGDQFSDSFTSVEGDTIRETERNKAVILRLMLVPTDSVQ